MAYYENSQDASSQGAKTHYRYDSRGNRVESLDEATGRRMHLAYDKGNQLVQVTVQEEGKHFRQRYRYDAFGRRLAKYNDPGNKGASEESGTDYYGWDGDRLVHTERFNSGNAKSSTDTPQPEVIHTVYEPGSFTPLIQLRRAAKAEPDLADELIAHMQPGIAQEALRGMFADIGATAGMINARIGHLGMAADAQDFIQGQLKEFEQTVREQRTQSAQSVEIRYYLCDHLGTPNALVNDRGQIEWATVLDAWGNVKAEHNPKELYQSIRLPGQHIDKKSQLTYNRHRYFDDKLARYISLDPIGLKGGINFSSYGENSPLIFIDPIGLQVIIIPPAPPPPIGGAGGAGGGGWPRDPDDGRPPAGGVIIPPPGIKWPTTNEDLTCRIEVPPLKPPKPPKPDCETQADMCWKMTPPGIGKFMCIMAYLVCKKLFKGGDGH